MSDVALTAGLHGVVLTGSSLAQHPEHRDVSVEVLPPWEALARFPEAGCLTRNPHCGGQVLERDSSRTTECSTFGGRGQCPPFFNPLNQLGEGSVLRCRVHVDILCDREEK
jgi:hypothetical protein